MIETERRVNDMATRTSGDRFMGRPARRGPYRFLVGLLLSLTTTVLVLGVAAIAWQQHYSERIIPGVWVAGVPLHDLTAPEAEAMLGQAWSTVGPRHLTLRDGDRQWVMPLEDLGVSWDLPATVHAAMAIGHNGSFIDDWAARLRSMQRGMDVPAAWRFDDGQANLALRRLAAEIDRPARSATFAINGVAPRSEPAEGGRELDVDASRQQLRALVHTGLPESMDLVIHDTTPSVADGEAARQRAEALLSRQVTVVFENSTRRTWSLGREVIAQALQPRQEMGADGLTRWVVDLKADPLAGWVAGIAREIDRPALEGRVRIDYGTMMAGISVPSQSGRKVDTAEALQRLLAALEGGEATVQLPVEVQPAYLTPEEVASWGKLSLLSEGASNFAGSSAARTQNIVKGASLYPGAVVPPGGIFSFNSYIGPMTTAEGWVEGYVIMGDRTEPGIGGGICQVATTAYRAAFYGGFPIVERYAHSYRVTTYEPPLGLDATIFTPDVDMRFRNDLPFPVIVDTSTNKATGALVFRFYGPRQLGRTVELEGPVVDRQVKAPPPIYEDDPTLDPGQVVLVDSAHDGLRATVHRIIKQDGKVIAREPFVSEYEPWPARYKRGPAR